MTALFWAVFVASLFGSLHCAGMCGGLVAVYAGTEAGSSSVRWKSHFAYGLGRLITYVVLGLMAGSVGMAVDFAGSTAGLHRFATVLAGATMTTWGLWTLMRIGGFSRLPSIRLVALQNVYRRKAALMRGRPPVSRAWFLGLLSALLPCGWLYAFVITAAGTADALSGGLMMAAFWVGTMPVMVLLGVSIQRVVGVMRSHIPTVTAVLLVVIGLYTVFFRSNIILPAMLPISSVDEPTSRLMESSQVPSVDPAASCHGD